MAFRKNIWFHSTHFQVKIKKSLVALPVTEMKRLRCAGLPQSYFCNLTRAALLLRLLSVAHLWKEEFSVFVQQFADSLMWLQVPPVDFHRYRQFQRGISDRLILGFLYQMNVWYEISLWLVQVSHLSSIPTQLHCRHDHCFTFIYSQNSCHFIAVFLLLDFKSHLHHFCEVSTL